jgi:hypothetical protein
MNLHNFCCINIFDVVIFDKMHTYKRQNVTVLTGKEME